MSSWKNPFKCKTSIFKRFEKILKGLFSVMAARMCLNKKINFEIFKTQKRVYFELNFGLMFI